MQGDKPRGKPSSSFRLDASFFLADADQASMTLAQTGAYITLMSFEWMKNGDGIPDDPAKCARLCRTAPAAMRKIWPSLRPMFASHPTRLGYMVHPELERERQRVNNPNRVREIGGLKKFLADRDGEWCAYCGTTDEFLEIEHCIPRARGGPDDPENLCLACGPCNRSKGTKTADEFRAILHSQRATVQ